MHSVFLALSALFIFLFSWDIQAQYSSDLPQLVVQASLPGGGKTTITAVEFPESSPEHIRQLLESSQVKDRDVLISTDQERVVEAAVAATAKPGDRRLLRIIPVGKLTDAFKTYANEAKKTLTRDRIGLTVLVINTGFDSYIWLHSASLSVHQQTSMVLMNVVLAATFGLDRDLFNRTIDPVKKKLITVFDRFITSDRLAYTKTVSSQFLASMSLGVGIQLVRTGLLSYENISRAVQGTEFWLHATAIGGLAALTGFAWGELYGSVNAETHPVTKMMLKRVAEMRGVILAQLASISMVLQPETYGALPVISFVVHGGLGLMALAKAEQIKNYLENSPFVLKIYKKVETFENFINSGFKSRKAPVLMCAGLFPA